MDPTVFDHDEALRRLGGDRELLHEVAGIFLDDAPAMLAAIERTLAEHDPEEMFQAAHKLKGAAANFSARGVIAATLTLERLGTARNLEGADAAFQRVRVETDRFVAALHSLMREGPEPRDVERPRD